MRNVSSIRLLTAAVGCLAIAVASVSLADDQSTKSQSGQPTGSLLDPTNTTQPAASTPAASRLPRHPIPLTSASRLPLTKT